MSVPNTFYFMDVIGVLSAFAPGDLAKLQYRAMSLTSNNQPILRSKFIVAFSPFGITHSSGSGVSTHSCLLICVGSSCRITLSAYEYVNIILASDSMINITGAGINSVSIALCPI